MHCKWWQGPFCAGSRGTGSNNDGGGGGPGSGSNGLEKRGGKGRDNGNDIQDSNEDDNAAGQSKMTFQDCLKKAMEMVPGEQRERYQQHFELFDPPETILDCYVKGNIGVDEDQQSLQKTFFKYEKQLTQAQKKVKDQVP